ncbi:UdgX family uracil-DNA binding protein [Cellulosimicrobium sp. Marseille-Q4280]|uniref:UdgX family uracil-DNA binding protein n=1 Tax=Cellulosimicrobium sp. Marseille-Q4280 TaxID=2937992 RepID=UPI0020418573|nr:UdgX family uracil-DNA binding protein [Cellulosimicrobium sp. Marseille-Q4280]
MSPSRAATAPRRPGAQKWVPDGAAARDVDALAGAVQGCRGCELWADATQAVFSRGADDAPIVLVGEQPGDREDREGEPFVGPAGRVLADAIEAAGIDRERVYLTNAVKHFRFEQRGKRWLHKTPDVAHVRACLPWLEAEVAAVRPRVVVALGATAARAVLGRPARVTAERGRVLDPDDGSEESRRDGPQDGTQGSRGGTTGGSPLVVVTTHPSALLRLRDRSGWDEAFAALAADLRVAAEAAGLGTRDA